MYAAFDNENLNKSLGLDIGSRMKAFSALLVMVLIIVRHLFVP